MRDHDQPSATVGNCPMPALHRRFALPVLAAAGASAFAAVGAAFALGEPHPLDLALLTSARSLVSESLAPAMRLASDLGAPRVTFAVVAATLMYLAYLRDWRAAAVVIAVIVAAELLNSTLKDAFARERPVVLPPLMPQPASFAYPSGHAMVGTLAYAMLALAVVRHAPRIRRPVIAAAVVLILATAASRVFLGVHWPTDIVGGLAAATALFALGLWALARLDSRAT
jgi:undecaprenyl-diphosphatase